MTEPKHTTGPWWFDVSYGGVWAHGEGKAPTNPQQVATAHREGTDAGAANARLIAAAPELLALVARLAAGEQIEAHGRICATDPCLRCEARVALAKAEARHG